MEIHHYSSVSEIEMLWNSYFSIPSVVGDYQLACQIEKSLFDFGIDDVAVVVFMEQDKVKGILPISYEKSKEAWSYYPSYLFISVTVTIDRECWEYLPSLHPILIHETSFKVTEQFIEKPTWLTVLPANVIQLTEYTDNPDPFAAYLKALDKKTRSKLKNCINRNLDTQITADTSYEVDGGDALQQRYLDYCDCKYRDSPEFPYFQNQLVILPSVFRKAEQLGQLLTIQVRLDKQLIALNYSIFIDDCLYDYVCYRDDSFLERSLGTFAILKNIHALLLLNHQQKKSLFYDLASGFSYKKQFLTSSSANFYQVTV